MLAITYFRAMYVLIRVRNHLELSRMKRIQQSEKIELMCKFPVKEGERERETMNRRIL